MDDDVISNHSCEAGWSEDQASISCGVMDQPAVGGGRGAAGCCGGGADILEMPPGGV